MGYLMKTMGEVPEQQYCNQVARKYLDYLLAAKRAEAIAYIIEEIDNGLPLRSAYLKIIQPVLYEIGRLWQVNKIDVAVEHYCSASTQLLMAQLFPYILNRQSTGYKMIGCCLGSELHEMGMRIVCDFFEHEGWDTYFTGAVTPGSSIIHQIEEQSPDLVCFSCTMQFGVHEARDLILQIKNINDLSHVKIMVGGLSFLLNPDLYKAVGADATARDAQHAVDQAYKII